MIQAGAVVGGGALSRVLGQALREGDGPGELWDAIWPFTMKDFVLSVSGSVCEKTDVSEGG